MSMKSFDKFCERLILAEPESKKEIYDERQKMIRLRLSVEVLLVYAAAALVNCAVMDSAYMWAESHLSAMLFLMMVCLLYWVIRCAAKGCLIAASGSAPLKFTSIYVIFIGGLNLLTHGFHIGDEDFFFKNGALSDDLLISATFLIIIVVGIFGLCVIAHEEKKNAGKDKD